MSVVTFKIRPLYPQYSLNKMLCGRQSRSGRFEEDKNPLSPYGNQTQFLSRPALSLVAIPITLSRLSIPSDIMSKDNEDSNLVRSYAVSTFTLTMVALHCVQTWIITTAVRNWQLTAMTCHPLPEIYRRLSDNVLILSIEEWSIEQHSASQLYIFLYSCSFDQRTNGHDFRFLQRYCRGFVSCGMCCCVFRCFLTFRKKVLPSSSRSDGSKKIEFHKNAEKQ
jgi:hypothetical protein